MKRTLLGLVAVAALGAMLVSTGAFVDTVEINDTEDKIEMEPSEGPNSVYAVENEDGEIKLDLSESNQALSEDAKGINEGSLTEIPNIFTVNYSTAVDDQPAEVWFTSDAGEGIEFVVGTDSVTSIDGNGSKRTLQPAEKLHIGVIVDTRGDHDVESVSEFTIHVERSSGTQAADSTGDGDSTGNNGSTGDIGSTEDDSEGDDSEEDDDAEDDSTGDDDAEDDSTGDDGSEEEQTNQDGEDTESEDDGEGDSEQNDGESESEPDDGESEPEQNNGESDGDDTTDDTEQEIGDGDDGEEQSDDDGGLQTAGQQPSFPGPEETLGGFLSGSFLWLILAALLGAVLFAAMRYGANRFGEET